MALPQDRQPVLQGRCGSLCRHGAVPAGNLALRTGCGPFTWFESNEVQREGVLAESPALCGRDAGM